MVESNRCWPGYEPVKGKKPHEQGSCRPKAESKTTTSEKQFRSKRKKQIEDWQQNHPKTEKPSTQHLRAPAKTAKKKSSSTGKKAASQKSATAKR